MCFEKILDKCWADLKKFWGMKPHLTTQFNYSKISKSLNIYFDGELSVEAMPFELSTRPVSNTIL